MHILDITPRLRRPLAMLYTSMPTLLDEEKVESALLESLVAIVGTSQMSQ